MHCQSTVIPKLNRDRRIGNVLFIVEGKIDEAEVLNAVFHVFNIPCARVKNKTILSLASDAELVIIPQPHDSVVYVLQAKSSNISTIKRDSEYLDLLIHEIRIKYSIRMDNFRTFFLFDRDHGSNTDKGLIRELLLAMYDPYASTDESKYRKGMLLISYPCIQSILFECHENECYCFCKAKTQQLVFGHHLKDYVDAQGWELKNIDETQLLHALKEFVVSIKIHGYDNPDELMIDTGKKSVAIFNAEEAYFDENQHYGFLSLLYVALLHMNLISFEPIP